MRTDEEPAEPEPTAEGTGAARHGVAARERVLGSLLGLAIGDALGMPVEGWSRAAIADRYGWIDRYLPRQGQDETVLLSAGEFTDDTEVALCHVEGLLGGDGQVEPETVGRRLIRLARGQSGWLLDPTTSAAIARMEASDRFEDGVALPGPPSGAVATQVVPVALLQSLAAFVPEVFVREVTRAARLTHADPESINGALAIAYAVRLLVSEDVPPPDLIEVVASFVDQDRVARRLRLAAHLAMTGGSRARDLGNLAELGTSLDVAQCVPAALYAFVTHPEDFVEAVLTAVNTGGDTDTVGALVGALVGAYVGASAIPTGLVDGLEGRMYILVAGPGLYRLALSRAGRFLELHQPA